jgi:hypothetical protein
MKPDDAIRMLRELREEATSLPTSTSSAEFNSWQQRTRVVLTRALGDSHHITQAFLEVRWTPTVWTSDSAGEAFRSVFLATIPEAQGRCITFLGGKRMQRCNGSTRLSLHA